MYIIIRYISKKKYNMTNILLYHVSGLKTSPGRSSILAKTDFNNALNIYFLDDRDNTKCLLLRLKETERLEL